MIPVSQYLIQSCIEELEFALESQVDRHCGVYICDGYINMSPEVISELEKLRKK
jgi:adenylate kinase